MTTQEQKTILLVEDEVIIALAEAKTIKRFGYEVITANSGEKAVELAAENKNISLVLMDIDLGKGINGPDAAAQIVKNRPLPIVFLTSHSEREMVEKVRGITRYGYIVKNSGDFVLQSSIEMAFELFEAHRRAESKMEELRESETRLNKSEGQLAKLNKCFLKFGADPLANINLLVEVCGDLLGAACALYNQLQDGMLCSLGQWNAPEGYQSADQPEGHICYDVIKADGDRTIIIRNLQDSIYAKTDPNVLLYGLKTYIGKAVKFGGENVGSLCVVYQDDLLPSGNDAHLMEIIASAIGVEEERKRTAEAVQENESKFRMLTENLLDVIWHLDRHYCFTYISPADERMRGFSPREVVGKTIWSLLKPEGIEHVKRVNAQRILDEQNGVKTGTMCYELELMCKNGKWIWTEVNVTPHHDRSGALIGYHGVARNITDRKAAERALSRSEERYQIISEKTGFIFYEEDLKTNKVWWSGSIAALTQYSPAEFMQFGTNEWTDAIHPDDRERLFMLLEESKKTKTEYRIEYRLRRKNGSYVAVEDKGIYQYDAEGKSMNVFGLIQDIAERKRAEGVLKENRESYRQLFDEAPIGYHEIDSAGRIVKINATELRMLGYSADELIGLPVWKLVADEEASMQAVIAKLAGAAASVLPFERIFRRKDGTTIHVLIEDRIQNGKDGSITGILSVVQDNTVRKLNEEAVRESEDRWHTLADFTYDWEYWLGSDGRFVYNSPSCERITGYRPEEFQQDPELLDRIVHPDDRDRVLCHIHNHGSVSANMEHGELDFRILRRSGEERWIGHVCRRVFGRDGQFLGRRASNRDITKRKQIENALHESEERYRNLVETMPDGMYRSSHEGKFLDVNTAMVKILGYSSKEELMAIDIKSQLYFAPEDRESAVLEEKLEETAVFRLKKKDGSEVWVEDHGRVVEDADGTVIYHEGVLREVTDRIIAESEKEAMLEALKSSEKKYRLLIDTANESIVVAQDGLLKFINLMTLELLGGYSEQDVIDKPFFEFIHPDDRNMVVQNYRRRIANEASQPRYSFKVVTRGGAVKWVEINAVIMEWQGRPATLNFLTDITERKIAEEEIADLLREKELLLHEVHHRIKNNMSSIMSLLSLQADAAKSAEAVAVLNDARNRMRSMLVLYDKLYRSENLRDLSVKTYLTPLIDEIVDNFPNRGKVAIEKNIEDFIVDARKISPLGIIINELLTNIMKHAFTGRESGVITVSASLSQKQATVIVQDDGIGLSMGDDSAPSSGFGLELVDMLMKQIGGTTRIVQENGTRFVLEFDVHQTRW